MGGTTERKRFRFSLKGLFLIAAILAVCITAYREGYRNGYKTAKDESQADYVTWKSPPARGNDDPAFTRLQEELRQAKAVDAKVRGE
jgi:hypothetical protein